MSKKALFSPSEWQMIADGPEWIFAALSAADGNVALTVKSKEASTFKKVIKTYSEKNLLVKEVINDKIKPSKEIKKATLSEAEQALKSINKFLARKLDKRDADEYRKFLTAVGQSVADAAGEGLLGVGDKLSKKEIKAIESIKAALKSVPSTASASSSLSKRPGRKSASSSLSKRPGRKVVAAPVKSKYIAEHTVKSGDTLSQISKKYYGTDKKYMAIYKENKKVIGNDPNLIKPGQVLKIPSTND